jgi:hypothetical protein
MDSEQSVAVNHYLYVTVSSIQFMAVEQMWRIQHAQRQNLSLAVVRVSVGLSALAIQGNKYWIWFSRDGVVCH